MLRDYSARIQVHLCSSPHFCVVSYQADSELTVGVPVPDRHSSWGDITSDTLATLSPYMTKHLQRFGDFLIDMETLPALLPFKLN